MMKTTTEMQLVPIAKLIPYVNNARTHSPEQINKLRSSLREFGFINPAIIDRDYGVIAGHGRILAAKEEGISEVPCVFADHLTEAQKKAYIIADNRMLNYHATFTKGTVEFRLFQFDAPSDCRQNGLHAGQLKSYIQLCLALSQMAKTVRTASPKPQQNENPKYAMRTWLLRLGFIGDEFKTARELLTKRLDGDAAFRSGRAA